MKTRTLGDAQVIENLIRENEKLAAALRAIRDLQAFAMTDGRGMRGDNGIELENIISAALGGDA